MDRLTIPKGTLIRVGGFPFELLTDVAARGSRENFLLAGIKLAKEILAGAKKSHEHDKRRYRNLSICQAYKNGESCKALAVQHQLSIAMIGTILRQHHIEPPKPRKIKAAADVLRNVQIVSERNAGKSVAAIGKEFNLSVWRITQIIDRADTRARAAAFREGGSNG